MEVPLNAHGYRLERAWLVLLVLDLDEEAQQLGYDEGGVLAMRPVARFLHDQRSTRRCKQLGGAAEEILLSDVGCPTDDQPGHQGDPIEHCRRAPG
jgi:hypothetical protein